MTRLDKFKHQLTEFHTAYRLPIARSFAEADTKNCQLRINLISEEYKEYNQAKERTELLDALGDTLYVTIGTAITVGVSPVDYQNNAPLVLSPRKLEPKLLFPDAVLGVIRPLEERVLCYRKLLQGLTHLYWKIETAAEQLGFDLAEVVDRIHASNMTKLWKEAEVRGIKDTPDLFTITPSGDEKLFIVKRASDGKVVKSPSYSPVDLIGL